MRLFKYFIVISLLFSVVPQITLCSEEEYFDAQVRGNVEGDFVAVFEEEDEEGRQQIQLEIAEQKRFAQLIWDKLEDPYEYVKRLLPRTKDQVLMLILSGFITGAFTVALTQPVLPIAFLRFFAPLGVPPEGGGNTAILTLGEAGLFLAYWPRIWEGSLRGSTNIYCWLKKCCCSRRNQGNGGGDEQLIIEGEPR